MVKITKEAALEYHEAGRPGKIEVKPTKAYRTQTDLSLAYSPGVAYPCLEIQENPDDAYKYTDKGNLVAVISNGTAVLGLGDIGAMSGKPVMEGKGLLFKIYGGIDVFDIEVAEKDPEKFCEAVERIAPTFGGINLEDIKAPECFYIEDRLKRTLDIPVMHDDQHGTAIISAAGLKNALEVNGKDISKVKIVVNGAGAAAISCTKLYMAIGASKENIVMLDSKGVISVDRQDLNEQKRFFATQRTDIHTLAEAVNGADVFVGLSKGNVLTKEMVKTMAKDPVIFALANPVPEISYEDAMEARPDTLMSTGRTDYPNQINNVIGFPYIFRGALDVHATAINEEMKLAAVYAIANLAKQPVPDVVNDVYKVNNLSFGRDYFIPKPVDPRLITEVSAAVAKAAIDSGQRVVFAEAVHPTMLKAAVQAKAEGICQPILLGNDEVITKLAKKLDLNIDGIEIVNLRHPSEQERRERYAMILTNKRQRDGYTFQEANDKMFERNYFGMMMVETGDADAYITGLYTKYSNTVKVVKEVIGIRPEYNHFGAMHIINSQKGTLYIADTLVNENPDAETLADLAKLAATSVRFFNEKPVVAMISHSNFGSSVSDGAMKVRRATEIMQAKYPDLAIDGEMQLGFALDRELRDNQYPFTRLLNKDVNTLVFPNLTSARSSYKMLQMLDADVEIIGPIQMGLNKPIHFVDFGASVRDVVNIVAVASIDAYVDKVKTRINNSK